MAIITDLGSGAVATSYANILTYNGTVISKAYYRESEADTYTMVYEFDNTPPVITVTSASSSLSSSYTLTGTITELQSGVASLTVNGTSVAVSGNSFSTTVTLSSGTNTYTIVCTDVAGNSSTVTHVVTYANDKDDSNKNWTQWRSTGSYPQYYYQIYYDGAWRNCGSERENNADSWSSCSTSFDGTLTLPKGIHTLTISPSSYGSGSYSEGQAGGSIAMVITDTTTGTVLYSGSKSDGAGVRAITASLTLTEEQATHTITVRIYGSANGYSYGGSRANLGLRSADSYSFTWY